MLTNFAKAPAKRTATAPKAEARPMREINAAAKALATEAAMASLENVLRDVVERLNNEGGVTTSEGQFHLERADIARALRVTFNAMQGLHGLTMDSDGASAFVAGILDEAEEEETAA